MGASTAWARQYKAEAVLASVAHPNFDRVAAEALLGGHAERGCAPSPHLNKEDSQVSDPWAAREECPEAERLRRSVLAGSGATGQRRSQERRQRGNSCVASEPLVARCMRVEAELEQRDDNLAELRAELEALRDQKASDMDEMCALRLQLQESERDRQELRSELAVFASRDDEAGRCVVCLDGPKSYAAIPCGHLALCAGCAGATATLDCPVCRASTDGVLRIFSA